jgi:hemolysin activation/secretion protein
MAFAASVGAAMDASAFGPPPGPPTPPPPPPPTDQAFERHDAQGLREPNSKITPPPPVPEAEDSTPLGADLAAVVLIGADDPATTGAGYKGLYLDRIPGLPRPKALDRTLARFLHRPISRKLISEIQAAVVKHYRAAGLPFLSVTPPPQDITDGVLRLRVVEFHLGKKTAKGAKLSGDAYVVAQVRTEPGDRLHAERIEEDLNWLNHSPFRNVTTVFSPGDTVGATNMRIDVQDSKRWQVYGGYADTGSPASGKDRWLLGGEVGDLLIHDSLLSYAFTGSSDVFTGHNGRYGEAADPRYLSHSLIFSAPLAPRQDFTLLANYVESASTNVPFSFKTRTEELDATYRTALSNFTPLIGDLSLGVESKGQQRTTYFGPLIGGQLAFKSRVDIGQFLVGWSDVWNGQIARQTFSTTLRYSPGNLGGANQSLDFANFTNNRALHAPYVYDDADYSADVRLPHGLRYLTTVHVQVSTRALLSTEQIALGGDGGVRAFTLDDGAFDTGVVWRNELRARSHTLFGGVNSAITDQVTPYAFLDGAQGHQLGQQVCGGIVINSTPYVTVCRPHERLVGAGLGLDYRLGAHFTASLTGAWALEGVGQPTQNGYDESTRAGHFKLFAHTTLRF